jgi:hypothetical protein
MAIITTPITGNDVTTVDFEDIVSFDGEEFGFKAGQPYAGVGLRISAALVVSTANLSSSSGGVAIRSGTVYDFGALNSFDLIFSVPQKAVGFYYRDLLATSIQVKAYDNNIDLNLIEEGEFQAGEGYAGFVHGKADIGVIRVFSPHETIQDAFESRFYMDDLSFSTTWWLQNVSIIRQLAWAWTIFIGGILMTPIGPICIACNVPIGDFWIRSLGIATFVLGGIGGASEVTRRRAR